MEQKRLETKVGLFVFIGLVLLAGLALLLIGFGFKIAAVPFHMWSPDVYQGSPSPITGFMAAVAKAGAFAALLRVFVSSFGTVRADWQPVVWALAVVSLLVGAIVALVQQDIKRMLAYSSINHVGFILLGVEVATTRGVSASLYYLFTYMFLTIGSFAVVTVMETMLDPVSRAIANAPIDDEPETDAEREAVAASKAWMAEHPGQGIPFEALLADFGISAEELRHSQEAA